MFGTKQKKKRKKRKEELFCSPFDCKGKENEKKDMCFFFSFIPTWRLIYNLGQKCKFYARKGINIFL